MDDSQHFATHADIERMRADILQRMGELEVRPVERLAAVELRLVEQTTGLDRRAVARRSVSNAPVDQSGKRVACWMIGLFVAQSSIIVGTALGIAGMLR